MFGFKQLTPEEKAALEKQRRIKELEELIKEQTRLRGESAKKAKEYSLELESLVKS